MTDREQVLLALLEQAFGVITSIELPDDIPAEHKEHFANWILQAHAMLCPNHPEEVTQLMRMYNATSN